MAQVNIKTVQININNTVIDSRIDFDPDFFCEYFIQSVDKTIAKVNLIFKIQKLNHIIKYPSIWFWEEAINCSYNALILNTLSFCALDEESTRYVLDACDKAMAAQALDSIDQTLIDELKHKLQRKIEIAVRKTAKRHKYWLTKTYAGKERSYLEED